MKPIVTYDIYICHKGTLTDSYIKLTELLNSANDFCYRNHSEEWSMPSLKNVNKKFQAVYKKMQQNMNGSACVLFLLDKSYKGTDKRRYEADYAAASGKPLIIVNTDGSHIPEELSYKAVTGPDRREIICAIKKYALYTDN